MRLRSAAILNQIRFVFNVKEADYLLTAIVGLSYRYKMVDFPASGYSSPFGTLVPYPKQNVNLSSIFKPLSYQVRSQNVTYNI